MRFSRKNVMADHWMMLTIFVLVVLNVQVHGHNVSITIMESAVSKGAVCLDGTPPAYHYDQGHGDGANNWLVTLAGGAWCPSDVNCMNRTQDPSGLGSSNFMSREITFEGIMSPSDQINPYFYNWNRVYVRYCDGASFSADVKKVNRTTNLHLRGARIFHAVMEELRQKGIKNATNAVLVGGSAGGLAAMLKCDDFGKLLHQVPRVKCISDGGLFFRGKSLPSNRDWYFGNVVDFHQLARLLPKSCTSRMEHDLCIFAENFIGDIKTPLFLIQSQFDEYQLKYLVGPVGNDSTQWRRCINGVIPCTPEQIGAIKEYRKEFIEALPKRDGSLSRGFFVDSCLTHDHAFTDYLWNERSALNNKTVAEAVADWYFDRSPFQEIENVDYIYKCRDA